MDLTILMHSLSAHIQFEKEKVVHTVYKNV